jgi:N-dimethylarginine dimethylaminohydrolase
MTVLDQRPPALQSRPRREPTRAARTRRYVMCRPSEFAVEYAINPWMDPSRPVDRRLALHQWDELVATFRGLGHDVETVPPLPGQPDMVFAANGALVVGDQAYGSQFRHPERRPEAAAVATWWRTQGIDVVPATHAAEGEGDFLVLGHVILAGTGFRTAVAAHVEAAAVIDRPFVTLELVDPAFYHLDVALGVLDDGRGAAPADIAYFPGAFSPHSRRTLRELFPDALLVTREEALTFGLNLVSDGLHVVLPAEASGLAARLAVRGYRPVTVDLSELRKAGGSVKCCTLEHHA